MRLHVGVGAGDIHIRAGTSEFLCRDLAEYRQRAGAGLAFAGDDGGTAVLIDPDDGGAAVVVAEAAAAVDVDAAADAEPAVRFAVLALLAPADHLRGLVDALFELAARDLVVVRRDVSRIHRIHA